MDNLTLNMARELVAQLLKDPRANAPAGPERLAYDRELRKALETLNKLKPKVTYKKVVPKTCALHKLILTKGIDNTVYKTCAVCNRKVNRKAREVSQCLSEEHRLLAKLLPYSKRNAAYARAPVFMTDGVCAIHQLIGTNPNIYKICTICNRQVNGNTGEVEAC